MKNITSASEISLFIALAKLPNGKQEFLTDISLANLVECLLQDNDDYPEKNIKNWDILIVCPNGEKLKFSLEKAKRYLSLESAITEEEFISWSKTTIDDTIHFMGYNPNNDQHLKALNISIELV